MAEAGSSGEHFVEKHQVELIKRVRNIEPILDEFLHENIIKQDSYDEIQSLPTSQEKMTALFSGPLKSSGGKALFYKFLDKHESYLIHELRRTEVAVKETLNDLSYEEFKKFKWLLQFPLLQLGLSQIPWKRLLSKRSKDKLVDVMEQEWGQQSVEVIKEVFMDMNRTDLVQRLPETSSGPKEKHSVEEPWSALIQKQVETMASDIELLLETLAGLSDEELQKFRNVLLRGTDFHICSSDSLLRTLQVLDKQDIVFLMVLTCGQQSVNKTKEILKKMNRTDLVQRLSHSSSGPKKKLSDEHRSALIQKVATKSAVKQLILETMNGFDYSELEKFPEFLHLIVSQKNLPDISSELRQTVDRRVDTVNLMMKTYGYQSVDLMKEVVHKMSSGFKGEHFVEKHQVELIKRVRNIGPILDEFLHENIIKRDSYDEIQSLPTSQEKMTALFSGPLKSSGGKGKALFYKFLDKHESYLIHELRRTEVAVQETLNDLSSEELKKFKWLLQFPLLQLGLSQIPWKRLHMAHRADKLVDVMEQKWGQQPVEVIKEVFMDMNRTDLVQRLPETSSGPKEKHSVEEPWSALIQEQVETMASDIELLLETLAGLSDEELQKFRNVLLRGTDFHICSSDSLLRTLQVLDKQDMVFLMVLTYGQQSVNKTKEVLKKMNRTDLVQRLSHSSSGPKKKLSDEHRSALIQKVATKSAVKQLILETMNGFDYLELEKFPEFLQLIVSQKNLPDISSELRQTVDRRVDKVDLMMKTYGYQSVDLIKEVVHKMSSGFKGKHFVEKHQVELIKRVRNIGPILDEFLHENIIKQDSYDEIQSLPTSQEKMTALFSGPLKSSGGKGKALFYKFLDKHESYLIHELRRTEVAVKETLNDLSSEELQKFKWLLQFPLLQLGLSQISWVQLHTERSADKLVDMMEQKWGQQPVEVIKEVFMDMNRTDLVQRLPETSSGPKEKHSVEEPWSALIQKQVETMASDIELLLETLAGLSDEELHKVMNVVLRGTYFHRRSSDYLLMMLQVRDKQYMVFLMVLTCGQQSVNKTKEALEKMNRTDLVQRLSHSSSGPKKKLSDEHRSALIQKVATKAAVKQLILETMNGFDYSELKKFPEFLQLIVSQKNLPDISSELRGTRDRVDKVDLMMQTYGYQSVDLIKEVVHKMSSGFKGPSRSLDHEDCGSMMQDSSDWTTLNPKVNSKDADETPTYSLQSEAGHFECSVSGLRWFCKGKVSFTYQFCSLEEHMERIESLQYMPAGPLMDITVIAGKLDEVYLPHWICIDDNPAILDKFAVLHIDDCGDAVEKVSEVTSSHVKLCEPVFSLKMVLVRVGFPFEVKCNVLIYKTNTAFLTLHVFLIPRDPGIQQELDKRELSYGYKKITKTYPQKSLKMKDCFILTTDLEDAEICPEPLILWYDSTNPNFFEVFIDNPDTNFNLDLTKENEHQPVWTCAIRKDEYQSTTQIQAASPSAGATGVNTMSAAGCSGEDFVNKHRAELIDKVSNIGPILDELLAKRIISQGIYDEILALTTTRDKMRKLYSGPLHAAGHDGKEVFYKLLEEHEPYLIDGLKKKK